MTTRRARLVALFVFFVASLFSQRDALAKKPVELGKFDVGHAVFAMNLTEAGGAPGVPPVPRPVDVQVWYPAQKENFENSPLAVYRSRFYGVTLIPAKWDPLSWELKSQVAREGAPVDAESEAFPIIVFSHGSTSSPIDFTHNFEHLASHGYIVAAPWHTRTNQDDVRANFLNTQNGGPRFMPCPDGRLIGCVDAVIKTLAINRVRDVKGVLDTLPALFGSRADINRVGLMGHSAGSITAILAAGGSLAFGVAADPRVSAVLTMGMITDDVIDQTDTENVTVPALFFAGALDASTPPATSLRVYNEISSVDKAHIILSNTVHRTFSSG